MPPKTRTQQNNAGLKRTSAVLEAKDVKKPQKRQRNEYQAEKQDENVNEVKSVGDGPLEDVFTINVLDNPHNLYSMNKAALKYKEKQGSESKQQQPIYYQGTDIKHKLGLNQVFDDDVEMIDTSKKQKLPTSKREASRKAKDNMEILYEEEQKIEKVIGRDSQLGLIEEDEEDADQPEEDPDLQKQVVAQDDTKQFQNKTTKPKKDPFPGKEITEWVKKISDDFHMRCCEAPFRHHQIIRDFDKARYKAFKTWYKKKQDKKYSSEGKIILENVDHPNGILMLGLGGDFFDEKYKAYIANVLEKYLPPELQSHFANKALEQTLKEIKQYCDDITSLSGVLQKVDIQIRLKATVEAIKLLQQNDKYTEAHKRSWFTNCIRPALAAEGYVNYATFDQSDVKLIQELCEFSGLRHLTDPEAFAYLKLLQSKNLFSLDDASNHFIHKDNKFWANVLVKLCKVLEEISDIWISYKENMITSAMLYHYRISGISMQDSIWLTHFNKLTSEELESFYKLKDGTNFEVLIECLDSSRTYHYGEFENQASVYLELKNKQQIRSCQALLKDTPLERWNTLNNQIIASSSFLDDDKALEKVKQAIADTQAYYGLYNLEKEDVSRTTQNWKIVNQNLQKLRKFSDFSWQKEMIRYLANLVIYANKKNIIATIETGHGKSLIIQLLADILLQYNQKVIVVCATGYLAYCGRMKYGSQNVRDDRITYMSLHHFLNIPQPDKQTHVIFDEIDQMIGVNSFTLIDDEETHQTKAIFNASLMRQWKSVIGFSGTISQSTISSIRCELKDPICIEIPSLRKDGNLNKISKVMKVKDEGVFEGITKRIEELESTWDNFIVIFKDVDDLKAFRKQHPSITDTNQKRKCIVFDDFVKGFHLIENGLNELRKGNFLILTTKEGARGVDYKGNKPAHVIMAFDPANYSECVQALGRGSRVLESFAEGTIICKDPLTLDSGNYLTLLQAVDDETSEALKVNSKIARMLHNQTVPTCVIEKYAESQKIPFDNKPHETFYWFQQLMKRGNNLMNTDGGDLVWKALRKFDNSGNMPSSFYAHTQWNQ